MFDKNQLVSTSQSSHSRLKPNQVSIQASPQFNASATGPLTVTIKTPRLILRSITAEDTEAYVNLLSDAAVMEKYASGKPLDGDTTDPAEIKRFNFHKNRPTLLAQERWGKNNPFSGFVILDQSTQEFIGFIVPGLGEKPGEIELGYLLHKKYWGQGYGTEAVSAIVNCYLPLVIKNGYQVSDTEVSNIVASTDPNHTASVKILNKVGLQTNGEVQTRSLGNKLVERLFYSISKEKLMNLYQESLSISPNSNRYTQFQPSPKHYEENKQPNQHNPDNATAKNFAPS